MSYLSREHVVEQFHHAFGHPVGAKGSSNLMVLRNKLISEEYEELKQEMAVAMWELDEYGEISVKTKSQLLKELADLQYVISGLAVAFGLPLQVAFTRVHKSNMSKLGEDGRPIFREDGKILKGPNYQPVDLEDLVE